MFDWTETTIDKGRMKSLVIEFEAVPEEGEPDGLNGDINYQLGYMDGEDFVTAKNRTLHFGRSGVLQVVAAIQDTETAGEAKTAVEDLLVTALDNAS